MQTNREDVGQRFNEIRLPVPPSRDIADAQSEPFRAFYVGTQRLREDLMNYLGSDEKHYIFMSSAAQLAEEFEDEIGDFAE